MPNVWGIHNDRLTDELIRDGFVSIGWDGTGNLTDIENGRDGIKSMLAEMKPDASPMSIANQAGTLLRFRDKMQPGDVIVAPYKPDGTVNLGVITGGYTFHPNEPTHRHRRTVEWKKIGIPRSVFTRSALAEISSAITTFGIKNHPQEFLAVLNSDATAENAERAAAVVESLVEQSDEADVVTEEPRASQIERQTRDFVLETLLKRLSDREFEEFTADLLRALGYQARATQYSRDGGIDVIAHRDPLGVEPPQIKVQCKHTANNASTPDVTNLKGVLNAGEFGLFVTLGNYPAEARAIERQNPTIRLLSGEDVVTLVIDNYSALSERWRTRIPLVPVLVAADEQV